MNIIAIVFVLVGLFIHSTPIIRSQSALPAPRDLRLESFTATNNPDQKNATITWSAIPQAAFYRIYGIGSRSDLIGTTNVSSFMKTVHVSSTHYLQVSAVDAAGIEGERSQILSIDYMRDRSYYPEVSPTPSPTMAPVDVCPPTERRLDPQDSLSRFVEESSDERRRLSPQGTPLYRFTIIADIVTTFSARFYKEIFPELLSRYGSTTEFVFKHYTLDYITGDLEASMRVQCLAEQNHFWQHLSQLPDIAQSDERIRAAFPQLRGEQYQACMNREETRLVVLRERDRAKQASVSGTPTFLLQSLQHPALPGHLILGLNPSGIHCAFREIVSETSVAPNPTTDVELRLQQLEQRVLQTEEKQSRIEILFSTLIERLRRLFPGWK